jgi:hypothetical protein
MVFWTTYPLSNIIQAKFNKNIFKSQIFNKESIESPTGINVIIISKNHNEIFIPKIKEFIKNNFGSPPNTPILDIPENQLLGNKDHILFLKDTYNNIIGCIRYHYLGIFITSNNEEIYCEDCFTVKKDWRKKGVGDYLLTQLHIYVNKNNIPYSMFLKEGRNLTIIHSPVYTGLYVFRNLESYYSKNVLSLSIYHAYKIMDLFGELNRIFIIRNFKSTNQFWKLYKKDTYTVLVCFQDAYQSFKEKGEIKKICWATAWIESPNMIDKYREEASRELSALMYPEFDYVWMNKEWTGNDNTWKIDGFFHWYTYQWTTYLNINKSYCILN